MMTRRRVKRLLDSLWRRPTVEAELDAELRAHVELETEELMRSGMSREEARRQAAIAFGGVQQVKEEALERGGLEWLHGLWREVRVAARGLARQRTFAVTAVLALGLAIAVNTTMFSVVDAMLNPPMAVRNPDRLFSIRYFGLTNKLVDPTASDRLLRQGGRTFDAFSGWKYAGQQTIEHGSVGVLAYALAVRANLFSALDAMPIEGRLVPGDAASASASVVISDRIRAQLFPGRASAVGRQVLVDGKPLTVIGVVRRNGSFRSFGADVWHFATAEQTGRASMLRLRAGVSLQEAEQELALMAAHAARAERQPAAVVRFQLTPIERQFRTTRQHVGLMGATVAVLLVACINLANVQLARGLGRAGELALRSSLGATRRQIIGQLVLESAVLAAAGLLLALLLANLGNAWVRAAIPPQIADYTVEPRTDVRMVLFAIGAAITSVMITGVLPAIRISRVDINSLLKSRAGTGTHRKNINLYGRLVALQIGLTMPLTATAVLLAREAWKLGQAEELVAKVGYDPRPLVEAHVFMGARRPVGQPDIGAAALMNDVARSARAIPEVQNATVFIGKPTVGHVVTVDGPDGGVREMAAPMFSYNVVTPGYFATFDLPIISGRGFAEGMHDQPGVVVDEFTSRYLWPYADAVGRRIKLGPVNSNEPWLPVIGVAGSRLAGEAREMIEILAGTRMNRLYRVVSESDSIFGEGRYVGLSLVARARHDPAAAVVALRRALRGVGDRQPHVQTTVDRMNMPRMIAMARFGAIIASVFALIALGLSALGVYGIVVQSVEERKREIAVRISLGATSRSIVRALIRDGNVFVLAGVLLGLILTVGTAKWIGADGLLEGKALLLGAVCSSLFVAMALSGLIPAFRATRLDPMQVLRAE